MSHAVRNDAANQRGNGRYCSTPGNHSCNVTGTAADPVKQKQIEFHVFDSPGKLADQAKHNDGEPLLP